MSIETVTPPRSPIDPIEDRAPRSKSQQFVRDNWIRFRALSPRNQIAALMAIPALATVLFVGNRVMNPSVVKEAPFQSEVQRRVAYESVDAPLNFLDITGAEYDALAPQAQVDYLLNHLEQIESRLLMHTNENYTALLSVEAARLREEAMKEGTSDHRFDPSDPTNTLDLRYCVEQMQTYQCALLRYAGDGLAAMGQALSDRDLTSFVVAQSRYQAALYALNDLEPQIKDPSSLLILSDNYRILLRQVVARSPASQRPPVMSQGAGTKGKSAIRTFVQQQGYKSEQLGEAGSNVTAE